jgi:CCS family citrate carrier protein
MAVRAVKMQKKVEPVQKDDFKIMGMSLPMFSILTVIVLCASYLGKLPGGLVGALPIMMIIGAILNEIGNRTPIIKSYFGGGAIVVIFGTAALASYGFIPEATSKVMIDFTKSAGGFLSFYIASLITGSILGMDRKLLIKASVRYLPVILGGVAVAMGLTGLVGVLMGYGMKEAILYVSLPIMGGGMGAGAVPLSQIFGTALSKDPTDIMSVMVPALALGNAIAIVVAGILNQIGKKMPGLTGNGKLMVNQEAKKEENVVEAKPDYNLMGIGLIISTSFFILGKILAVYIPLHSYALMIISVAIVKALGVMPSKYETGALQWFRFVMANLTPALLVGIGIAYTDLNQVIAAINPTYVMLVFTTVVGSVIGSGFVGRLMGFYPIEAAITGGLCMANMGGTGDVAVLSASDRMELMPFAQISSRIGGAFMLILATSILKLIL